MFLGVFVIIFAHYIPVPASINNDGVLEDFTNTLHVVFESTHLTLLIISIMLANALQANLGMSIIKRKNAVVKATVALLLIPALWVC